MKEVHIISEPSKTRKLVKYLFDFPWPLAARHCFLEFNAVPVEKGVVITMKTPVGKYLQEDLPALERGATQMWVRVGCIHVEFVNENETRIIFLISADGNIVRNIQRFLPNFLLNFGTKHIMFYMMEEFRNKIGALKGSIYEERIKQRHEYYEFLRRMMRDYQVS